MTLRSYGEGGGGIPQIIEGYISEDTAYISRLDRFHGSILLEGTMLVVHNYDTPGKIGGVGMVLGKQGVNINFMQVAGASRSRGGGAGAQIVPWARGAGTARCRVRR